MAAGCSAFSSGMDDQSNGDDAVRAQAIAVEVELINSLRASKSKNAELNEQLDSLIAIHLAHVAALDPNLNVPSPTSTKQAVSPSASLGVARQAQLDSVESQTTHANSSFDPELTWQLTLICASEAQCSAALSKVKL